MGINLGSLAGKVVHGVAGPVDSILPDDLTPGFNIDRHAGGGIPFISRGNGSTGMAPVAYHAPAPTNQSHVKGDVTTTPNGTTYQQQQDAANQAAAARESAAYGTYGQQAHSALGDLLSAYNTTKKQLTDKYSTLGNELQGGFNNARNSYDNSVTQQNQDQLRQENQIRSGTAAAYHNLMNMLGAYGGGASSVATEWAPGAAQNFQNMRLGDANQNVATNLRNLNTTWGNYQNDFDRQKKQLADQQATDLGQADSQYNSTRDSLNRILDRIANRSVAADSLGAQVDNIESAIPNLKYIKPSYTGQTPVYNAPSLSSFEAALPTANLNTVIPNNSSATPALALLLAQQRKNQQNNLSPVA